MYELKDMIEKLEAELAEAKKQVEEAVDKKKKVAVGRARKNMMNIKKLAQDVRVALQMFKENM